MPDDRAMPADERTPLLSPAAAPARSAFGPIRRVHFTSLLMSMTFGFTQTALVYSFREMTCDEYYKTHPDPTLTLVMKDRCSIPEIEASTAHSVALMSTMTVAGTIVNMLSSAWVIGRFGVKAGMFQQTFWAALRNLCQIYAQIVGGQLGITITIATQVFNVVGSGGGFQLCANSFISILASEEERTAQFGILQGVFMLGSGIGFTVGGVLYKYVSTLAPFVLAFAFLVFCTLFGMLFLPYIAPEHKERKSNEPRKCQGVLAPLAVFLPKKDMYGRRNWAIFFLGIGTFLSVLATGYVAMALQLVATNVFDFKPDTSGYMLSLTLVVRAFFLSVCFPRIIAAGRKLFAPPPPVVTATAAGQRRLGSAAVSRSNSAQSSGSTETTLVEEELDADGELELTLEPSVPGAKFDLIFLKYSILLDGFLTSAVTFSSSAWHMYLAAVVLPFASGTGPAVKGVILEFATASHPAPGKDEYSPVVSEDASGPDSDEGSGSDSPGKKRVTAQPTISNTEKSNILSGIALIEKFGQIITISLFGYFFALLSEVNRPRLIFLLDGAIAFLAFAVLLPVHMPKSRGPR